MISAITNTGKSMFALERISKYWKVYEFFCQKVKYRIKIMVKKIFLIVDNLSSSCKTCKRMGKNSKYIKLFYFATIFSEFSRWIFKSRL